MFSFVSAESGTMPKSAAGLPAGANVNHMRNERRPAVISRQSILSGTVQHRCTRAHGTMARVFAANCYSLSSPHSALKSVAAFVSSCPYHPKSVPQHASNARRNSTRDATRQFRILGKSFRATHELWCDRTLDNPAAQGSPLALIAAGLMLLCL